MLSTNLNRLFSVSSVALLAVLIAASIAGASDDDDESGHEEHGHFDVFVGVSGGQTAYGGIEVDEGEVTLNERVFESEMGENPLDNIFFSDEPGFNHPESDAVLPAGVDSLQQGNELFVRKLTFTVGGVSSDLFFWDGVGSPSFAPAGGTAFDIVTPGANQSIGMAGAGGGFDDHPLFELSAGGSFPTPGIYLGSFEAQVDGASPSDPLFLVMGTDGLVTADFLGITQAEFDLLGDDELDESLEGAIEFGVEFVESNVVPEPGSSAWAALLAVAFATRKRRRRR